MKLSLRMSPSGHRYIVSCLALQCLYETEVTSISIPQMKLRLHEVKVPSRKAVDQLCGKCRLLRVFMAALLQPQLLLFLQGEAWQHGVCLYCGP